MENTSGFYQVGIASSVFSYAPNSVMFPDGTELIKEKKDTYKYPLNDWIWFDSIEEAYASQGKVPPKPLKTEPRLNNSRNRYSS